MSNYSGSERFPFESKYVTVHGSKIHYVDEGAGDPRMLIPLQAVPWIENNFPNITMVDIEKGTHYVQEDHPDKIGSALADWYSSIH